MKYLFVSGLVIFLFGCSSTNNAVAPVVLTTPVTFNGQWGDYINLNLIAAHGSGNAAITLTRADDTITGHYIRYSGSTLTIIDSGSITGIPTNKPTNSNYLITKKPFGTITFDDPKINISYKYSSGFSDSSSVIIDANR
jgi:hypothetical protein